MIQALVTMASGRVGVVIGLDKRNLDALRDGKPAHMDGKLLGLNHEILIVYGETYEDIAKEFRAAGFDIGAIPEFDSEQSLVLFPRSKP